MHFMLSWIFKYLSTGCENCPLILLCYIVTKQKEEGKLQGQLNKSDSNQYIRELKDQIAELNHEVSDKFWSSHISFFLPLYCNNTLLLLMIDSFMVNIFCESLIIINNSILEDYLLFNTHFSVLVLRICCP